jgi:Tfp pilus assembly protein PilF
MHTFTIIRRASIVSTCAIVALLAVARVNADSIKPKQKIGAAERAFNRGMAALDRADWGNAEAAFQEVLKLDKKAAPAMLGLAKVAAERGDRKTASVYLQ